MIMVSKCQHGCPQTQCTYDATEVQDYSVSANTKKYGKKQTGDNFYEKDDTFKFTIHVSVAQRPSSVESRIKLKLHLNL